MTALASKSPKTKGGKAETDFVVADLLGGDAVHLSRLRGRPAVLIFFKPSSKLAGHVLRYAQSAAKAYSGRVHVFAMAVEGEPAELAKLRTEHRLEIPLYDGRAAVSLFAGRSTPRVVVLDQTGKVRLIGPGWGGEFPAWIHRELLQLAP